VWASPADCVFFEQLYTFYCACPLNPSRRDCFFLLYLEVIYFPAPGTFIAYCNFIQDCGGMGMTPRKQGKGSGTILVMDDDKIMRLIAMFMLNQLGYEAEEAANGEEALALYEKQKQEGKPFDAVILDIRVDKGMGGEETMRHLRRIDPEVKAIISSGCHSDPLMVNFMQYGFNNVLPKPYGATELERTLSAVFSEGAGARGAMAL
jgi:CheY-like chemotaxis protein